MQIRKVYSNGSSLVVTLPAAYADAAGIMQGDSICVSLDPHKRIVIEKLRLNERLHIDAVKEVNAE